jgi:hypothetical protein
VPLLVLFFARGATVLHGMFGARVLAWLYRRRGLAPSPRAAPPPADQAGSVIGAFYARVVVMHVTIIASAFLSFLGTLAPLIILIALKTAVDLGIYVFFDLGDGGKAFAALIKAREAKLRQRAES